MSDKVAEWLDGLGLSQYVPAFIENEIDHSLLTELADDDLKEIGVRALGHRKTLLRAIGELE